MMLKVFCCISSLIYMGSPLPFLKKDSCKRILIRVFRRHWQRPAICLREERGFLLICAISNKMWPGKSFFSGKVQINHKGDITNSSACKKTHVLIYSRSDNKEFILCLAYLSFLDDRSIAFCYPLKIFSQDLLPSRRYITLGNVFFLTLFTNILFLTPGQLD